MKGSSLGHKAHHPQARFYPGRTPIPSIHAPGPVGTRKLHQPHGTLGSFCSTTHLLTYGPLSPAWNCKAIPATRPLPSAACPRFSQFVPRRPHPVTQHTVPFSTSICFSGKHTGWICAVKFTGKASRIRAMSFLKEESKSSCSTMSRTGTRIELEDGGRSLWSPSFAM